MLFLHLENLKMISGTKQPYDPHKSVAYCERCSMNYKEMETLDRISECDIQALMNRLDTLLEERMKEKYEYIKTAQSH